MVALCYHDVVAEGRMESSGRTGSGPARFKLTVQRFRAHLEGMAAARSVAPVTMSRAKSAPRDDFSLLLTFDDGGASAMRIADLLEEYGWRGHFLITAGRIGSTGFVDGRDLRELSERGHVVGSHTYSHPIRMSSLSREDLLEEWSTSAAVLGDLIGRRVDVGSVPGGYFSRRVARAAASAGYRVLFTSEPTTRTLVVDGCLILGRYAIWRTTDGATAAALATRSLPACWRQTIGWNAKKILKKLGGTKYPAIRKWILERT